MSRPNLKRLGKWAIYALSFYLLIYACSLLLLSKLTVTLQFNNVTTASGIGANVRSTMQRVNKYLSFGLINMDAGGSNVRLPSFVDSKDLSGPGEGGLAVNIDDSNITSAEDKARFKAGWSQHYFNEYASGMISIHRSLPDCRSLICKQHVDTFNGTLPEISVIIIFKDEAWTTLLRSVHSVLSRTPEHLLKEIILVDDNSTFDYLKAPLDKYMSTLPKVKIIHSPQWVGLTRARLLGFEASVAPVVVFLDSHIECFPGWIESSLIRMANNRNTVVFPVIENINSATFKVKCKSSTSYYGTFEWKNLLFNWVKIPDREHTRRQDDTDPFRSPVMPGGLFAISREFFQKIGTYDPSLEFWGGENIELSFKTWMCGGSLELDTCSHVGHVFRKSIPVLGGENVIRKNSIRVAEVWMDDYKNYFYENINYKLEDVGNITDRIILRKHLQCKNFDWYLKNVFPEKTFPHGVKYAGEIKSLTFSRCLDINSSNLAAPILYTCKGNGYNQFWYLSNTSQIQQDIIVICVDNGNIVLRQGECETPGPQWEYKEDTSLYHIPTGNCITADEVKYKVFISPCMNTTYQKWNFQQRRTDLNFPIYS